MTPYPGIQLSPSVYITYLEFADDVSVLGDSPSAIQAILDRTTCAAKVGFEINTNKTEAFSTFPILSVQ